MPCHLLESEEACQKKPCGRYTSYVLQSLGLPPYRFKLRCETGGPALQIRAGSIDLKEDNEAENAAIEDRDGEQRLDVSREYFVGEGAQGGVVLQVRPGSMDVEKVHEALNAALEDRDAARQMCQGVRAMLAQSDTLRKADPDKKVLFQDPQPTPCWMATLL